MRPSFFFFSTTVVQVFIILNLRHRQKFVIAINWRQLQHQTQRTLQPGQAGSQMKYSKGVNVEENSCDGFLQDFMPCLFSEFVVR
jgi:uncharacterized membrane protein (Fun14 family)